MRAQRNRKSAVMICVLFLIIMVMAAPVHAASAGGWSVSGAKDSFLTSGQQKIFNKLKYQYLYEFLSVCGGQESERLDYCASFIVAGMCTLAKVWIENGMRATPEEMARLGGDFVMHGVEMLQ